MRRDDTRRTRAGVARNRSTRVRVATAKMSLGISNQTSNQNASGSQQATNTATSGAKVWNLEPTTRGVTIESQLAQTEYRAANGWYQGLGGVGDCLKTPCPGVTRGSGVSFPALQLSTL